MMFSWLRGRLSPRLLIFYGILAAVAVAVVIVVVAKGKSVTAEPSIAGGYAASAPNACLGPTPKPVGGTPLPATAPAQARASGPSFSLEQFHNNFLRQGFPPIKIVREALMGDDSPTL